MAVGAVSSLAFDEFGHPFFILCSKCKQKRLPGKDAIKSHILAFTQFVLPMASKRQNLSSFLSLLLLLFLWLSKLKSFLYRLTMSWRQSHLKSKNRIHCTGQILSSPICWVKVKIFSSTAIYTGILLHFVKFQNLFQRY